MIRKIQYLTWSVLLTVTLAATGNMVRAADTANAAERERNLISVLTSDAPPAEKAITCKKLAIYGSKNAVPALASLLTNPDLCSWARIALEAIPDPAADDALRAALDKVQGRLLIGVINSIGYRRDAKATEPLVAKLKAADTDVVSAAAVALGHIGGPAVARTLQQALTTVPAAARSDVAEGCVLCAEQFMAGGQSADAVRLYDLVRGADVSQQRILEGIRGAILARKSDGLPLLLEQLRSPDKARLGIGLRTARELPGRNVTEALAAELKRCDADRQSWLLLVLADRGDAAALPTVNELAATAPTQVRIAALGALEQLDRSACVPALLLAASQDDAELVRAAKAGLRRLAGSELDAAILARLPQASGDLRRVLIDEAGQRQLQAALPEIVKSVTDSDAGVCSAAVRATGALGNEKQAGTLVALLQKTQGSKERGSLEQALVAIIGRHGPACLPALMPLAKSSDSGLRKVALHTLSSVGGPKALAVVATAVDDEDEGVQDEAVRALSTWASNWPDDPGVAEPLLALAKSGRKMAYQVQGVRGYLQYVQECKQLGNDQKVTKVSELMPLVKRPEEKRLAVATLSSIPSASALKLLMTLAPDDSIAEEACLAIAKLAARNDVPGASKELRHRALLLVVQKSKNDATRNSANEALKQLD